MVHFDFNLWERLAREDPDRFESLRKQIIEYEIKKANSSGSKRLSGLQFQIDMKRKSSGSAMGACIKISRIMTDHFHEKLQPILNSFINDKKADIKSDTEISKNNIIKLFEK